MPDSKGARPYASYLPGEHPQDPADLVRSLSDPSYFGLSIQREVQTLLDNLDPADPLSKVYRQALSPGGPAWTNTPFSLLVQGVANILAPVVDRMNLMIDTVNYLHLGQPGYIPSPDPGNEEPGFEYAPWDAPEYPSALPDVDQDPIEKL